MEALILSALLWTVTDWSGEKLESVQPHPKCIQALEASYATSRKLIKAGVMRSFDGKCLAVIEHKTAYETQAQKIERVERGQF